VTAENLVNLLLESDADDVHTHACNFVEEEVGRLDFLRNWLTYKNRWDVNLKVENWARRNNLKVDADAVAKEIDRLHALNRPWRG
jgi:hypothetical protein